MVTIYSQVEQIQDDSRKLQAAYAGDKAKEITNREAEVVQAWMNLQGVCLGFFLSSYFLKIINFSNTGLIFRYM